MGQVHVSARLADGGDRRAGGSGGDDPCLQASLRRIGEAAALPDVVAVAADQVRIRLAICLRMDDQDVIAHIGRELAVALQRAGHAVEHDVGRDEGLHGLEVVHG